MQLATRTTTFLLTCGVAFLASASLLAQDKSATSDPKKKSQAAGDAAQDADAFATIGPALVKGNFHQYPPFYSTVIAPHAVVVRGQVYCAFQNTKGQPTVMVYDVTKQAWDGPVYASQFGLGKDAHGNPSICLDRNGYIHIFFGCHGGPMRHARSQRPYDIHSWSEQTPPTSRATKSNTCWMSNRPGPLPPSRHWAALPKPRAAAS